MGGKNGLFYGGNAALLAHQALAVMSVAAYSLVVSALIALAIKHTIGLRVSEQAEDLGLDLSQHGESAYDFGAVLSDISSALTARRAEGNVRVAAGESLVCKLERVLGDEAIHRRPTRLATLSFGDPASRHSGT